jgi:hypothetical protein
MKFGKVLLGVVFSLGHVFAAEVADAESQEAKTINFSVDYKIQEFPNVSGQEVIEIFNGDNIHLEYKVHNNELDDISVIGVGGILIDPTTMEVKVNLTSGAVGPLVLGTNETKSFVQDIPLNLIPATYIFSPQVFIVFEDQIKLVPVRGQLATVSDAPISWFNPQLLVLELILIASLVGAGYFAYQTWGKQYVSSPLPQGKGKKQPVAGAAGASATASASATGSKSYDSSWLPEHHLQKKKKAN